MGAAAVVDLPALGEGLPFGVAQLRVQVGPEGAAGTSEALLEVPEVELVPLPPAPPPSGWEDVGDDKVLAALRSLEAMGFVDSLGADACLARVQMHMTSSGAVDLDAAVADLVALMKGSA